MHDTSAIKRRRINRTQGTPGLAQPVFSLYQALSTRLLDYLMISNVETL